MNRAFFRVEQEVDGESRFYVVHSLRPRFSVQVDPGYDPEGKPGRGFVKALRIANGWGDDYRRCIGLINKAEAYFREEARRRKAAADDVLLPPPQRS